MTSSEQGGFVNFPSENLMPQEEMLEIKKRKSSLIIGIPKESLQQENRVALAPVAVNLLVENGHRVLIESEAGKSAHFSDSEYSESGGEIVNQSEEVFKADIILKVAPLSENEIGFLKERQIVISSLHLAGQNEKYFKSLMTKKVTAISFEK